MNEVNKLYKEFLNKCYENNYSTDEIDKIIEAYEYAYLVHKGQKRKNGDEFIIHPLTTALLVANLNTDVTTVISALVHESVGRGLGWQVSESGHFCQEGHWCQRVAGESAIGGRYAGT
jgi:(p)ppGpp synthase/HD superfamily hydrolase